MMGGDKKHSLVLPAGFVAILQAGERNKFQTLRCAVVPVEGALYGFARSGLDFILSFGGWLVMNR